MDLGPNTCLETYQGCYMVHGNPLRAVSKEDHLLILLKYQDQERINTFQSFFQARDLQGLWDGELLSCVEWQENNLRAASRHGRRLSRAWGSGTPAQISDLGITLDVSSSHLCPWPVVSPFSPEPCRFYGFSVETVWESWRTAPCPHFNQDKSEFLILDFSVLFEER